LWNIATPIPGRFEKMTQKIWQADIGLDQQRYKEIEGKP
jgi:hypothetical protein